MIATRYTVVCSVCDWRGNRKQGDEGFGLCPKCQAAACKTFEMHDRRAEKAKAQLAVYTS